VAEHPKEGGLFLGLRGKLALVPVALDEALDALDEFLGVKGLST
jgi:hypothetical protein